MAQTSLSADPNYRYSINYFPGDGERTLWDINFAGGFIRREHVKARTTSPAGVDADVAITWITDTSIQVIPAAPFGYLLTVWRETPKDAPIANFQNGAVVNESNLDDNARQAVFIAAEALDRGEGAVSVLSPRSVLVPVGEVAPGIDVDALRGHFVGVNLIGEFVPLTGGESLSNTGSDFINHDGSPLNDIIEGIIANNALTNSEVATLATTITGQGLDIVEQATSVTGLIGDVSQLQADYVSLGALVDALTALEAGDGDSLYTLILSEETARITADTAFVETFDLLGAKNGAGTAFILDVDLLMVSPTVSLGTRLSALSSSIDGVTALITSEATTRAAADVAEVTARQALGVTVMGNVFSAVAAESAARASAIAAEASARTTIVATLRGETAGGLVTEQANRTAAITAAVATEAAARATADGAEATNRVALAATLRAETTAAVLVETNARVTAVAAEAGTRTALGVTLGNAITAQVLTETNARAAADNVLTTNFSLLGARNGANNAFIINTATAQLTGGTSLAATLSAIYAADAANTASIAVEQSARVAAIGTLEVKYGVTLDVNGFITGFSQNNNGTTGSFVVKASSFLVAMPGHTPRIVFGVDATGVKIDGDLYMGSGRIISVSAGFMKVQGTGFGTTNQFIEWFGPEMAVASCNEASATYFLKKDGTAYFGGALLAGSLHNAMSTSGDADDINVTLSSFSSAGASKSIVVSYSYNGSTDGMGASPSGTPTAQIKVYRGGDNSGLLLGTLNVTGTSATGPSTVWSDPGETILYDYTFTQAMGGSITVTDSSNPLTTGLEYYAEMSARSSHAPATITQLLSLSSTEA